MSEIVFACPGCGQTLQAPPELAGETTECPSCAQALIVPALDNQTPEPEQTEPDTGDSAAVSEPPPACPDCGATLAPEAVLCVECGYHLKLRKKISTEFS